MNSLMSNNKIRRGVGVLAVFTIIAICFSFVPNADAASRTDRGPSRADGGKDLSRAEGDADNIGGARVRIHADVTVTGECGGGGGWQG